MHTDVDPLGNPITVEHADSAAAVADFVGGFLAYQPRIARVLEAARRDRSLIVQAAAAALWMFSESPVGPPAARAALAVARAAGLPSTERKRQFAEGVALWAEGDVAAAIAVHAQALKAHPRDLAALKLAQVHAFNLGDSPTMLRLALQVGGAADEVAEYHGMRAFSHEQCHELDAAETSARRALQLQPAEPWAEHALAHVLLTQGRHREGRAFMQRASGPWNGLTSFMRTHNWWHLALFHIELGDEDAALALCDDQVWGVDKTYSQDQINAVSLLARLELAGCSVGERWQDLADHLQTRTADQTQPFLDLQYLYGLARAGRPEAAALMANIERHAPAAPAASRTAWLRVAVPAAQGLLAHAGQRYLEAAEALSAALPRLSAIGGSHAQRDLFEQIYRDALLRSGQTAGAWNLLKPLADAQPESVRLKRQVGALRERLQLH